MPKIVFWFALILVILGNFLDITNTASSGGGRLRISDIAINAQAIGVSLDQPEGDILINPGETKRVAIDYTPTEAGQSFDLSDGLVIHSNAINNGALEVHLAGQSTFNSDISYDGQVNLAELGILNVNFGSISEDPNFDPTADTNADGMINLQDLGIINAEFGSSLI